MFLLSAICSLIFLQSKSGKRQTLWKGYTKSFVSCFAILFFIRKLWERAKHLRFFKREPWVCKSNDSKMLFPDIGKITNP